MKCDSIVNKKELYLKVLELNPFNVEHVFKIIT